MISVRALVAGLVVMVVARPVIVLAAKTRPRPSLHLGCHGTLYVPNARGWYAYPVRTVRGTLGASRPVRPVRTQRGRLVRVARTSPTEAPGCTCQLRQEPERSGDERAMDDEVERGVRAHGGAADAERRERLRNEG